MKRILTQHPLRLLIYTLVLFCGSVGIAFAQGEYQPLTGIPGVTDTNLSLAGYVNALFLISIAVGALLAVIKIAIAGLKYMLSEVVTTKGEAIADINGALLGLGILLAAVIVLGTINPELVNLNILGSATQLQLPESQTQQGPSHDEIREDIRNSNPVVDSEFTGQFGSQAHVDFLYACRENGGQMVLKDSEDRRTVECRRPE